MIFEAVGVSTVIFRIRYLHHTFKIFFSYLHFETVLHAQYYYTVYDVGVTIRGYNIKNIQRMTIQSSLVYHPKHFSLISI